MGSPYGLGSIPESSRVQDEISSPPWALAPDSWIASEAPIPIPSTAQSGSGARVSFTPEFRNSIESQRTGGGSTAPSSWQTPSSWGGSSVLINDEVMSLVEQDGDLQQQEAGDGQGMAEMTYAQRRMLMKLASKKMASKSSASRVASRYDIHVAKEKWTKRLEDFRTYELGYVTARLPYKAAMGTTLAAFLFVFAPFTPESIRTAGGAGVVGVGMSLEPNVGLTLQKGSNVVLGAIFAAVCAVVVTELEPYTGSWRPYYLVGCVFLGAFVAKRITLPQIVRTRWEQTLTFYLSIFHALILSARSDNPAVQFFIVFLVYLGGMLISLTLSLWIMPEWAGDSLVAILVSDFHTAGVVLERIVEDYKTGTVLTKIQELLSGVVTEDHIHHDLQYIMKSTEQAKVLINAAKWEPKRGFFFDGYPWHLYATLLEMLVFLTNDLIALDAALRAEIQAPLEIREYFAEDMEMVARECSSLFHRMGEAFTEHKKIDYHTDALRARLATKHLSMKLVRHSEALIATACVPLHDQPNPAFSRPPTRGSSLNSVMEEEPEEQQQLPTAPHGHAQRIKDEDFEIEQKLNMGDSPAWLKPFLRRHESIDRHWAQTKQQISSLSFVKFAGILIEITGKVKAVVSMVDHIAEKAQFSDAPEQ